MSSRGLVGSEVHLINFGHGDHVFPLSGFCDLDGGHGWSEGDQGTFNAHLEEAKSFVILLFALRRVLNVRI